MTRRAEITRFVGWLTGSRTQAGAGAGSARSFRRQHAWCWNVEPVIAITGEIYDEVQLDGTYLAHGWCLLLAIDGTTGTVIALQWCDAEKTAAWTALLEHIPPPRAVVIDGGSGLASALTTCWPDTRVQRCLVHVQRNVRRYLTTRPRTEAGKTLRALSLALTKITTLEQATDWQLRLHAWHQVYGEVINAKTYLKDAGMRPAWAGRNATWWWTHDRLRKAYRLLARLNKQDVLFTYLDPDLAELNLSSTTNRIEGGANHPIKDLLRRHRGMTSPHHWQPTQPTTVLDDDQQEPDGYDTATTAEEGLWTRSGWAGRSHR